MCCILYIPAGVETPTIQTLEAVFMYNRHGIGFADSDGHCQGYPKAQKECRLHHPL